MSKKIYIGQSDLAKEVKDLYIGITEQAKRVEKAYIGVNGIAKQIYPEIVIYGWNRYSISYQYKWNRYSKITTVGGYREVQSHYADVRGWPDGMSSSYEFNQTTGKFRLTGSIISPGSNKYGGLTWVEVHYSSLYDSEANIGAWVDYIYWARSGSQGQTNIDKYTSEPNEVEGPGNLITVVRSTSSSAYPDDGASGNYWYKYIGYDKVQGSASGSVTSTDRNAYPDNGISGNYWYVYTGIVS